MKLSINILNYLKSLFYTKNEVDTELSSKAESSHVHDERYYTESEVDTKLSEKSNTNHTHNVATTSINGLMSNSDKSKLDNIAAGATKITVDSSLSDSSTNPVQNKVINSALAGKASTNLATSSSNGLMSSSDKSKLDGIATNANNYSLPTATSSTLGGVKVGTNLSISNGILSATNTTYGTASSSSNGLMSSSDKSKLDGIASSANKYSLPTASSSTLGGIKVGSNLSISNGVLSATNTTYGVATTSANGLMSSSDKSKLNGIASGATANTIDSSLSSTSTNAVQNKVINSALAGKASTSVATTSTNGLMSSSDKSKLDGVSISTLFSETYNSSADFIKVFKITFLGITFYNLAWNFKSGSSVGPEISWYTNSTFTPGSPVSGYIYSDDKSYNANPTLKGKFLIQSNHLYIYLYDTTSKSIGSYFWTF